MAGKKKKKKERRRVPRVAAKLPLTIKGVEKSFKAKTYNISPSGIYCTLDRFVPLNTKLGVTIVIPEKDRGKSKGKKKVQCGGIVVRNEPRKAKGVEKTFGMALFFTDIAPRDRAKICNYIKPKLSKEEQSLLGITTRGKDRYKPGEVFSTGIPGKIELEVSSSNFKVVGEELRISRNGICCQTDRSIPLFREIAVNLVFPSSGRTAGGMEAVQCQAVVVGCDRIPKTKKYDMAAYFVGLTNSQKDRLEKHIKKIF
jgi:hypothetical protein